MIQRVFRRCTREPMTCIAAILFTAVLTVILCFLHRSQLVEQKNFEKTYNATPLEFVVTWLDGTRLNDSSPASGHFADLLPGLFLGNGRYSSNMPKYIDDLQIRMVCNGRVKTAPIPIAEAGFEKNETVVGITSTKVAKEYDPSFGMNITWLEGYDESILRTEKYVCIAPSVFEGLEEVSVTFTSTGSYTCKLKIVGLYPKEENYTLYCPYFVMETVYTRINEPKNVQHLSGKIANNGDLEAFLEAASEWFATPNPLGEHTHRDNIFGYEYYPLAIDIDDSLLKNLQENLQQSMTINRIAAALVFALSAGAGFLTGFLVIRSRKREIGLMRTLGTSNLTVCMELEMKQILCVAAGVIIGGSYSLRQPVGQLCIFAGVYIAGLTVALLVFTRTNLLATMKEDE